MPLRFKCAHCSKELLLEEVFRGAGCRCQFCRGYMRVPVASTGASRPTRPLHPPLIGERTAAVAAKMPTAARPKTSKAVTARWRGIAHSRPLIAAAIVLFASSTALTAWLRSGGQLRSRVHTPIASKSTSPHMSQNSATTANDVHVASARGELKSTLFGVPVDGNVVAYIVDSDTAMGQYIDKIAAITNFVNKSIPSESRRFGIVRNNQQQGGEEVSHRASRARTRRRPARAAPEWGGTHGWVPRPDSMRSSRENGCLSNALRTPRRS